MGESRGGGAVLTERISATGSTNADLAARIAAGERIAEGHWLIADRQTLGRGRHGRRWSDGSGNFMGSTVVHPGHGDPPANTLALMAGLAVLATTENFVPPPVRAVLKWPNDILVGSAKLCGILLENVAGGVVIGVGVNLAYAPELADRQTIALTAFGPAPDRDAFAAGLAASFDCELERWRTYGLEPLVSRWQAAAHPLGTPLAVGEPGETPLTGTYSGLTPEGALQLRLADGTLRAIHAGEVRLAEEG